MAQTPMKQLVCCCKRCRSHLSKSSCPRRASSWKASPHHHARDQAGMVPPDKAAGLRKLSITCSFICWAASAALLKCNTSSASSVFHCRGGWRSLCSQQLSSPRGWQSRHAPSFSSYLPEGAWGRHGWSAAKLSNTDGGPAPPTSSTGWRAWHALLTAAAREILDRLPHAGNPNKLH